MNLFRLQREVFHSRESTLNWCIEKNLLPATDSIICSLCQNIASFEDAPGYSAGRFRCGRRIGQHTISSKKGPKRQFFQQSGSKDTFFFNSKIGIEKTLVLTYCL